VTVEVTEVLGGVELDWTLAGNEMESPKFCWRLELICGSTCGLLICLSSAAACCGTAVSKDDV
jgi:hypothetical protein